MPSSISSSDTNGKWVLALMMGLFLSIVVISAVEALWRASGHRPTVTDDKDLWTYHRHRIDGDPTHLVLLGASRMQIDLSIPVLERLLPDYRITQLAIDGLHPIASLRDLAADPNFRGVVICSIIASGFEQRNWDHQQPYVTYHHANATLNNRLNRRMASFFQERLIVLHPWLKMKKVLVRYLQTGKWPQPYYLTTHSHRGRDADYTRLNIAAHKKNRLKRLSVYYEEKNRPLSIDRWRDDTRLVEGWVEKIQQRGGRVTFIRLPTAGRHWQMDQQYYPRTLYWDDFAHRTAAATLHFKDVAPMNRLVLPDTSHIDVADKALFTEIFVAELIAGGLF